MEEKSIPSSTPTTTPPTARPASSPTPRRDQAWRPRVDSDRVLHGFDDQVPEADSILESPKVRDADEDTAPLQGSKDRSDKDSMEDIE